MKKEVLYNILMLFGIPTILVELIKMCLNESYCTPLIGKYVFYASPIRNGLKQGYALQPFLLNFAL
jgi:hypothetical protein